MRLGGHPRAAPGILPGCRRSSGAPQPRDDRKARSRPAWSGSGAAIRLMSGLTPVLARASRRVGVATAAFERLDRRGSIMLQARLCARPAVEGGHLGLGASLRPTRGTLHAF